ncbi:MAG: nucleotidyl transferase AbiEii/AbiGii toxin family protein [Acidobacteriota bacterium]|nr:nucleotidyl transferase AbiEii/AbiGii toxin family protein [Acidobacteriota bacterium]
MAALDLPTGPRGLLARTRTVLAAAIGGESHLILGGGTVLIARWHHRWTHDLDFFTEASSFQRLYQHQVAFERDLWALGGIRSVGVRSGTALIVFEDGGEISIATTPGFTSDRRSPDTVRKTSVALESSAEILAKKIGGRILGNNTFVPRDLYDLVMARQCEPAALDRAFRCFAPVRIRWFPCDASKHRVVPITRITTTVYLCQNVPQNTAAVRLFPAVY